MTDARDFLKYKAGSGPKMSGGVSRPPRTKSYTMDAKRHILTPPTKWQNIGDVGLRTALRNRRSRRAFSRTAMTEEELSFLLWATQGVQVRLNQNSVLKATPSAGGLHVLETYLFVNRVTGIQNGLYRYLPLEHQLLEKYRDDRVCDKLVGAVSGQSFMGQAAVTFVWTTVPYRMEMRYGEAAHKFIAMEAGHTCQNLYLACEAVGAGTCAVAVYHQVDLDRLLEIDGKDEFAIYLAPVGKIGR